MVPHKVDDTISKVYVERGAEPNSVEKGNRIILLLLLEHFFCLHLFSHFGSQPGHRTNLAKKFFHLLLVITGSLRLVVEKLG